MYTFSASKLGYANLWRRTVLKPARKSEAIEAAHRILADTLRKEGGWSTTSCLHDFSAPA